MVSDLNDDDEKLLKEVLIHAHFCKETADKFHGRDDLLKQVILRIISIIA